MAVLSHGHSIGLTLEAGRSKVLAALVAVVPLIGQAFALCFHSNSELLADLSNHALGLVGDHNGQLGCGGHHDGALSGSLLGLDQIGSVDRDTIKVISGGEISGNGIVVRVENVLEQHGGLLLAINLSQIIHEAVAQLNSRSALVASAQSNVERVVQIGGRLGAQSVAIVLGSHVSIDLICLILGTLIVQGILGVGAGADCGQVGVGQAGQNPTIAAGSDLQRLQILVVRIVEGVEPLGIANIISVGEAVSVLVAVISDPSHNICPVIGKVVIVTVGDHIQRGVAAALALPQVVTPVVVSATLHRNLVDNGGGNAISIVVVVGTAGSEYIEELVRIGNSLVSCQHLLCSHQVAVQVGRTGRHILNGLQTVLDNVLVVLLGQEGQFHCHIVIVLNSNQTQLDIMTLQNQRLNQVNDGIVGVRISALYAVILCDTGTQGQDDVHIILGMVLDGDGGIVFGSTDESLGSVLTIFGKIANNIDCAFFSAQGLQTQQVVVQSFHTSGACGVLHSLGGVLGQIVGQFVGVIVEDLAPLGIIHNRISSSVGVVGIIGALPDSQLNGCDDIAAGQVCSVCNTCCSCCCNHVFHSDIGVGVGDNSTQLFCYFYREYVFNSLVGVNILVFSANGAVSTINNLKVAFAENIFTGIFPALCDVIIQKNEVLRNCGIVGVVTDFISGSGEMKNISILYIYFEVILNVNNFEGNVFAETDIAIGSDKFGQLVGTNLHIGEGQLAVGVNGSNAESLAVRIEQCEFCAGQRIAILVDLLDHDVRAVNHGVSNLGNGEHLRLARLAITVHRIQSCGIVGRHGVGALFGLLLGQLQLVGQMSKALKRNVFAEGPNESFTVFNKLVIYVVYRSLAVAVVVIQPEGGLRSTGSGESVGAVSAFLGCNLSGGVVNTADIQLDVISVLNELEVAVLVIANVVYNGRTNGAGVEHIITNGVKEVFLQNSLGRQQVAVGVTLKVPNNRGFTLTCQLGQIVHKCMANLNGGGAGILRTLLDVFRTVLVAGGFATDGIAVVTGCNQLLPNLNTLILCAFIVQCHRGIVAGTAAGCNAGDKVICSGLGVNNTITKSAGSNAQSLKVLIVSLFPGNICTVVVYIEMRGVHVLVAVSSYPFFNVSKECFVAIVVTVRDHIQRGVTATLGLPQIVAPVVGSVNLVNNGSLLAVGIVEPVSTAGSQYEYILVFSLCLGFCSQHLLCFQHLAVQVGGTIRQIVDGIELFSHEFYISSGIQNSFVAVQVQDDLLTLFQGDQTHSYGSLAALHCGLENTDRRFNGFHVSGHAATKDEYYINVTLNSTGNGQGDIGLVLRIQAICRFVNREISRFGLVCASCKSGQADTGADCDRQHKRKQSLHFVCHVFILLSNI